MSRPSLVDLIIDLAQLAFLDHFLGTAFVDRGGGRRSVFNDGR